MPASPFSAGSPTNLVPVEQLVAADYKITDVDPRVKEWEGSYGPMVTYTVTFDTGQEVEFNQKPTTPAPTVGQTLHGVVEEGKFGLKFKKVQAAGGSGGSWAPKQDNPDQRRSIERQVSAKLAVELIIAGKTGGKKLQELTDIIHMAIEGKGG